MRILVTNDDGIESEGLHILARAAEEEGHDVFVIAPNFDASGTSSSLGPLSQQEEVTYREANISGLSGPALSINGPPALCVIVGHLGAFGEPPDLVLSGINPGLNTGRSTLHSGTVGAVLTAQNFGSKGIAVSLHRENEEDFWQWDTAAQAMKPMLELLQSAKPKTGININVPALSYGKIKGNKWARLAPFGSQRSALNKDPSGNLNFGLVDTNYPPDNETDLGLVMSGYVAISILKGISTGTPTGHNIGEDIEFDKINLSNGVDFWLK